MHNQRLNIGLFGLGVVGKGLLDVLRESGFSDAGIRRICVKDPLKPRAVPRELLTYDAGDILGDPEINVVVETISDPDAAFEIARESMRRGKHVVTANKKMLAAHLPELLEWRDRCDVSLLYESAACGSIPIVRTIDEHFGSEPVEGISGIFNGTSNYILSRMSLEGLDFETALRQAQASGFAEEDPSSDIDGLDAKYKLILLAAHSHGVVAKPDELLYLGIRHIGKADMDFAKERGMKIKLLPQCTHSDPHRLAMYVMPALVGADSPFYQVEDEYNGVQLQANFSGHQFFRGRGAGAFPTGSALLSDLGALQGGYRYAYRKHRLNGHTSLDASRLLNVYVRMPGRLHSASLPFEQVTHESLLEDGSRRMLGSISLGALHRQSRQMLREGIFAMQLPDSFEK